jgi:hypothetical protein
MQFNFPSLKGKLQLIDVPDKQLFGRYLEDGDVELIHPYAQLY